MILKFVPVNTFVSHEAIIKPEAIMIACQLNSNQQVDLAKRPRIDKVVYFCDCASIISEIFPYRHRSNVYLFFFFEDVW